MSNRTRSDSHVGAYINWVWRFCGLLLNFRQHSYLPSMWLVPNRIWSSSWNLWKRMCVTSYAKTPSHMPLMVCSLFLLANNTPAWSCVGYEVQWDKEIGSTSCQHILTHIPLLNRLECSDIDWNSTGSVVAVGYGHLRHEAWCTDKGFVCLVCVWL